MKLSVKRFHFGPTCTIGRLYVDDTFYSYTLEDTVREKEGVAVDKWKVFGQTAIPKGTYTVAITMSNRFKRELPQLLSVDRKSTRLNSSHSQQSRMPSSA